MTPDQLIAFIEEKMSMQHVYQPLLIKVLVESGGSGGDLVFGSQLWVK